MSISVTFDRPVTATTFMPGDLHVLPVHRSQRLCLAAGNRCRPGIGSESSTSGYAPFPVAFNPLAACATSVPTTRGPIAT